jgi:hypothetical protein
VFSHRGEYIGGRALSGGGPGGHTTWWRGPGVGHATPWCGCFIRLKYIYNFLCSMLVYTPFALCLVTLHDVFMHFPELTYYQDATVPVPCFLLFLCFRKVTQEKFSELDETKVVPPIFTEAS